MPVPSALAAVPLAVALPLAVTPLQCPGQCQPECTSTGTPVTGSLPVPVSASVKYQYQ